MPRDPNYKPKTDHLIDISKRPNFKELVKKGGSAKSPRKSYALLVRASTEAKCKNCKVFCDYKDACLRTDPEHICPVPTLRAQSIRDKTKVISINDDKLKNYLDEMLAIYMDLLRKEICAVI